MKRSFDHLARPYALLERALFGHKLEQARFCHLSELGTARRVLLVGEGDGRVVERLLRLSPGCHVDVVDKSAAMIARAKQRVGQDARVTFHTMDVRAFRSLHQYDALTTLFFLDCFEEPELTRVTQHLANQLAPGGYWLYADFAPASEGTRQRAWLATLYAAFGLLTDIEARHLVYPETALASAGLVRERQEAHARRLFKSELWRKRAA